MTSSNLAGGIYTHGHLEYVSNGTLQVLSGPLTTWPSASNSADVNYWTTGSGTNQRAWYLDTVLKTNVLGSTPPIYTQQDFEKSATVIHPQPLPRVFASGQPTNTTIEAVLLVPRPKVLPGALLQQRTFATNAVNIATSFYWPAAPFASAGYTAPLVRFVQTSIMGLTTDPILLTNYFSQTYRPTHHNFTEEFIFEPRLEPGLPAATLAELKARNIQLIYVFRGFLGFGTTNTTVRVLGLDQAFRSL
jgi:hypothetical protein